MHIAQSVTTRGMTTIKIYRKINRIPKCVYIQDYHNNILRGNRRQLHCDMVEAFRIDNVWTSLRIKNNEPYILPHHIDGIKYKLDVLESYTRDDAQNDIIQISEHDLIAYPATNKESLSPRAHLQSYLRNLWSIVEPDITRSSRICTYVDILLTHGSDDALRLIFECFAAHDGARIIIPIPTYPHAAHFARNAVCDGGNIIYIEFEPRRLENTQHVRAMCDEDIMKLSKSICAAAATAKCGGVIYLANPNLPYGYCLPKCAIDELALANQSMIIVVDQAYIEFGDTINSQSEQGSFVTDDPLIFANNVIVTRTFSKFYALADLRIGYIVARNCNIINCLKVIYNAKSVSEFAAGCALRALRDNARREQTVAHYRRESLMLRTVLGFNTTGGGRRCGLGLPDSNIYDWSFAYGNFYLLYARDVNLACATFEARGIQVRDKTAELIHDDAQLFLGRGVIRVCVSSARANRAVCRAIFVINARAIIEARRDVQVAIDLDGTLRPSSWSNITLGARRLLSRLGSRATIVTNNTSAEAHILLDSLRINFGVQVSTPLGAIARAIAQSGDCKNVYCMCSRDMRDRCALFPNAIFEYNEATVAQAMVLLDGCAICTAEQYYDIGRIMAQSDQNIDVYIGDRAVHSSLLQCSSDIPLRQQLTALTPKIMMPDVGSLGILIAAMYPRARIHYMCKPYDNPIVCDYYIGDGECDKKQKIIACNADGICARIIIKDICEIDYLTNKE